MADTVIVAIPPVGDRVHKVSSERVAHLTLLYLGEADLSAEAVLYVNHVCSSARPFGLVVDRRGTLGDNDADVLFFEKKGWGAEQVATLRHNLLLNDEIKLAYDAVGQFPEWTPHLTLGYPSAPAHISDEEQYLNYVDFDRVFLWTEDFDGPEFRLKNDDGSMEVSMSDMATMQKGEAFASELFHYGKKGMKWGVRNDAGHEGEAVKTKNLDKLDKKWEADINRTGYMKLYNAAADKMNNGGIDAINNKPEYKDADLSTPGPLQDKYYAEHEAAFQSAMVAAGPSLGMNPSGTKAFVIKKVVDPDTGEEYDDVFLEPIGKDVKHGDENKVQVFRLTRNKTGHILKYTEEEAELKHYGKKGMKWGVTTVDKASTPTRLADKDMRVLNKKDVTVTQRRPGKFVKAKGGQRQEASDDAIKSAAGRQKAKKSTTDSLTNAELKATVERLQLETQFNKLSKTAQRQKIGQSVAGALMDIMRVQESTSKPKK